MAWLGGMAELAPLDLPLASVTQYILLWCLWCRAIYTSRVTVHYSTRSRSHSNHTDSSLIFYHAGNIYPAPSRGTGYWFRAISFFVYLFLCQQHYEKTVFFFVCLFVCLFVSLFLCLFLCQQHYEKTAGPIYMKFSGNVWSYHGTTWFNFGSIRVNGSAGRRSNCLLSPAIAQTTGVKKSAGVGVGCASHHSLLLQELKKKIF